MFAVIFRAELRHWLRQPLPYLFAVVLLAIAFTVMWGTASEAAGGASAEVLNSASRLSFMTNYLSLLLLFLLPSVVGAALHRDYKSRMHTLLYVYPLTKRAYLSAKFGAALLVVFAVVSMIGLGFALGAMMPGIRPEVVVPFAPLAYLQLYLVFLWPNMLLFGLLVFLVVVKTRNIYLAFIAIILLVAGQAVVGGLLQTADLGPLAALLDPTGDTAVKSVLRGYTLEERNTRLLPFAGLILANRLLWLAVLVALGGYTYRTFSFSQFASDRRGAAPRSAGVAETLPSMLPERTPPRPELPPARSGRADRWRRLLALSTHNTRYVTRSYAFAALLLVGLLTVFLQQAQMSPEFGFATLPTTGRMLRIPMFIFGMSINLITFLYVGVLAHRGRMTRMGDLVDVSPVSNRTLLVSRLLAILRVQLLLLLLVMIGGVATQLSQGYGRVELWHYMVELFGLQFVHFAIWACMATLVHTLFGNLYLGFFVLLLTGTAFSALAEVGSYLDWPLLTEGVVQFNTTPRVFGGFAYSDWNGYGGVVPHYLAYKGYWLLFGVLLLVFALAFWRRGYTFSGRERRMRAWRELGGGLRRLTVGLGLGTLTLGATLYYHDHVLAGFAVSDATYEEVLARNERSFGRYLYLAQPRIARVEATVDLYPHRRAYTASGTLWYVNKGITPLDTVIVSTSLKDQVTCRLVQPHEMLLADSLVRTSMYRLAQPLRTGDSLQLHFTVRNAPNAPLWASDRVKTNGTYLLGHHILPRLGVRNTFLSGARQRAAYGLPPTKPRHSATDSLGYGNVGNNMDRIRFRTTVSTSADQEAFSMGTLQRRWSVGDRRYFRYASAGLITNNVSWLSGRYATTADDTGVIPLQLHNHPDHLGELPHFQEGVKRSLALNTGLFGPLAYDTLKLVEFPLSAGSHATLNGNLIPTSEAYLLCDVDHHDNESFNVPFFVGAHEVAHFWWGQRVDPANVAGGRVITEGLADYLAIATVKATYGPDFARRMISRWREIYFRQRAGRGNEVPLLEVPTADGMDYLNYRKSALAFHCLAGYLGEERLHAVLAAFERRFRHAPPPYATLGDLVGTLRAATPDSLRYLVHDLFETITLYDHEVVRLTTEPVSAEQFETDLHLRVTKYRADARGKPSFIDDDGRSLTSGARRSLPLADYIDLTSYAGDRVVDRRRVQVTAIDNHLRLTTAAAIDRVVVDEEMLLLSSE